MSERGEVAENDVPTSHKNEGIFISRKEKHNRRVNKHGWHDEIIIFACKDIKSTLTTSNEDKTLSKQDKF